MVINYNYNLQLNNNIIMWCIYREYAHYTSEWNILGVNVYVVETFHR